ncbi:acanthoscurrin-1-like [Macrobrachium nipponense]|uniref:acanthoscurrin-1-like n=1 Tax=Macrobrachium nipponense TaxID=159736 RepID=UPI0030C879E8
MKVFLLCSLAIAATVSGDPSKDKTRGYAGAGLGGAGGGLGLGGGGVGPGGILPGGGVGPGGILPGGDVGSGGIFPGGGVGPGGILPGGGVGPGGIHPGGVNPPATCRYWCRTPEGQAYCCESNQELEGPVGVKIGNCPRVRPQCPPVRFGGAPTTCSNDFKCAGADKCCYDVCLEEHVCKPQSYFG